MINTFIKPSEIHGLGLFACGTIKKGEEIEQGYPDYSYYKEWKNYINKGKLKSMAFNKNYCMINHSCEPNVCRGKEFEILAIKNIEAGEEITENYYDLSDNENPFINNIEEVIYWARV